MHTQSHPLAGKTVKLNLKGKHPQDMIHSGDEYRIEDWWDKLTGGSWGEAQGNPAAIVYAFRAGLAGLEDGHFTIPPDDEVVYGKVGRFGHLIHVSELGEVVEP